MKSLHFIIVYNVDNLNSAKNIAERELKNFGLRNIGKADWYEIGSVVNFDGSEFTTPDFDRPVYTVELANEQVKKWLNSEFPEEMMNAIKRMGSDDLSMAELSLISRYYENKLAAQNYRRKFYYKPFDIAKASEFNAGLYDEFGASWIVNSFGGNGKYIVVVYKK
jgi:hypothetical protein